MFETFQFKSSFEHHQGSYVHNAYLGLATQVGVAGALAFFIPLVVFLVRSVWRNRRDRDLEPYHALEGVVVAGLVACLFESWIYSMGNAFALPFWLFVMLLVRENELRRAAAERQAEVARLAQKEQRRRQLLAIRA